jgi:gliding motility-associated-like protein
MIKSIYRVAILLILALTGVSYTAQASHGQGADITYKYIRTIGGQSCYEVTLTLYRDCSGIAIGNTAVLNVFDSCSGVKRTLTFNQVLGLPCPYPPAVSGVNGCEVSQICNPDLPQTTCNSASTYPGVQKYVYADTVCVDTGCFHIRFSTQICARNPSDNISTTGGGCLYVEAITNSVYHNSSAVFAYDPVPFVCATYPQEYLNGGIDPNGDSLVYELITPLGGHNSPNTFNALYSVSNPIQTVSGSYYNFSTTKGNLIFTPMVTPRILVPGNADGEVDVLAVRISDYRFDSITNTWILMGSNIRDVQVKILQCVQTPPQIDTLTNSTNAVSLDTASLRICPGVTAKWDVFLRSPNYQRVSFITPLSKNPSPLPGAIVTSNYLDLDTIVRDSLLVHVEWTPTLADAGCHSYQLTAVNEDCPIKTNSTRTYTICVAKSVEVTPHSIIYCGTPIKLKASGGTNPAWSPNFKLTPTFNPYQVYVAPTVTTKYTFTSDCGSDTALVIYNPPFTLSAGLGGTICRNGVLQLNASVDNLYAPYRFKWIPSRFLQDASSNPNDSILDPYASPPSTTKYTFQVTASTGCIRTDTVTVVVKGVAAAINATAKPTVLCPGDTSTLIALGVPNECDLAAITCNGTKITGKIGSGVSGYGGGAASYPSLYGAAAKSARHQFLLKASDILALTQTGGQIQEIGFQVKTIPGVGAVVLNKFRIAMECTYADSLNTAPNPPYLPVFKEVFTPKTVTINAVGKVTHVLDKPYDWDGKSNIIIDICFENAVAGGKNPKLEYTNTSYRAQYCTFTNISQSSCGVTGGQAGVPITGYEYTRPNVHVKLCQTQLIGANLLWTSNGPDVATPDNKDTSLAIVHAKQTFTITYTDTNNCKSADFVTINIDTSNKLNIGNDTFICASSSTIGLTATVKGLANLSKVVYTWYNLTTGAIISSGTGVIGASITVNPSVTTSYFCMAYDSSKNMCTLYDTMTVSIGTSIPVTHTVDSITCFGANDGRIIVSAAGASAPITYTWTPTSAGSSNTATPLGPGTYTVSVVDGKGCAGRDTIVLVNPPKLLDSINHKDLSCFGYTDGTINVYAYGGRPTYTYNWSPTLPSIANPIGLGAGTYNVTITDQSGCTAIATATLIQPSGMTSSAVVTPWTGATTHDGTAQITTTGGTTPYTYTWSPNVSTTDNATGLDSICYYITVTDKGGCKVYDTACVPAPPPILITFTKDSEACYGDCTAKIKVATIAGGVGPYTYLWSTGSTVDSAINLCAGTYKLTTTDANGIKVVSTILIYEPTQLILAVTKQDITCFGANNGSVTATYSGGTPAYSFSWNGGVTTNPQTNVGPAKYVGTVIDANGCMTKDSAVVIEPASLLASLIDSAPAKCFGDANGRAVLTVAGGVIPYTYAWAGSTSTNDVANDLQAGPHSVTITDKSGCSVVVNFTTTQPNMIGVTATPTPSYCATSKNGSVVITTTGSGGVLPFTYSYNGGASTTLNTANNLDTGDNVVIVTDSVGCKLTQTFRVDTDYVLHANPLVQDSVHCFGGTDGIATISGITGYTGSPPPGYKYLWSNGLNVNPAIGLPAGVIYLTVTDPYGCLLHDSIDVLQPAQIVVNPYHRDPLCTGNSNGKVWLDIVNGNSPYTYSINNNTYLGIDTAFNIKAGTYQIHVIDAKGCTQDTTVTLVDPAPLVALLTVDDITCANLSNGGLLASATGGTSPYSYTWSINRPEDTTVNLRLGLGGGTYYATVTDVNGCSVVVSQKLISPPPITFLYIETDSVSCPNKADGILKVHVIGGTPSNITPYLYTIDSVNWQKDDRFFNLAAGSYHVYVVDSNLCMADTIIPIYEPLPVIVAISPPDTTILAGSSAQIQAVLGGNPNQPINKYTWYVTGGFSCVDCPAPIASPYETEDVSLVVNYGHNCYAYAAGVIHVVQDSDFYVPNAFTPDGNDNNDQFRVFGKGMSTVSVKVFNRWGEKVFDSQGVQWSGWDGTYQGTDQPTGVYTYVVEVEFLNGSKKQKQGTVSIIR